MTAAIRNAIDEELLSRFRHRLTGLTVSDANTLASLAVDAFAERLGCKPWELEKRIREHLAEGWQDISTAPMNGTPIVTGHLVRYLPYKPDGQRQMKKKGRWQEWNGYGWSNIDWEPEEWKPAKANAAQPPAERGEG